MQLGSINNLKKYYSDRLLLDIDKFEIMEGDRIGVVGENGAGKTTLIKILMGEVKADEGITYITGSSSTGSKFYKHTDKTKRYIKLKYDKEESTYTMINVSENNLIIMTYKVDDNEIIDNKIIIEK